MTASPYLPPPAQPPSWWRTDAGRLTLILVGTAVAAVLTLCAAVGRDGDDDASSGSGISVEMTSCRFSDPPLPRGEVGLKVTNKGSETRSVTIRIEYRDSSGARVDTDTAYVRDIAPGDTVKLEESTYLDGPVSGGRCRVVGVD